MKLKLQISLSHLLRQFNDGEEILEISPCEASQLPSQIAQSCPQLGAHLFNKQGEVSGFVNIYINGLNYRDLDFTQQLSAEDRIEMVTSLVGG